MSSRFLVTYHIPTHVMDGWMKLDAATRQPQEEAVMTAWQKWEAEHAAFLVSTEGAGKTRLANAGGIAPVRNDVVVCSIVQADSHDAAAEIFKNHPHFTIPEASIQIMELKSMR